MEQKFDFVEVTLDSKDYELIKEVYRLHKEQANKIFDLAVNIKTDEDILNYIKDTIEYDEVLLAIDKINNRYAGVIILRNICIFNKEIIRAECHLAIGKKYWGKQSREIIYNCYNFLKNNFLPINRLEAKVPSNNFGIIKLLKDTGFKIEGTCNNKLLYNDKNNKPKLYNELIYSNLKLKEYK